MVFPPSDVLEGRAAGKGSYTLPPGTHEYPWNFKVGLMLFTAILVLTESASCRSITHVTPKKA
jgi:hypothetical protein